MSDKYKKIDKSNLADTLLDTLPNPVYYKDTQGVFIKCNTAFEKLLQTKKSEIMGKDAYNFFPKEVTKKHKIIDQNIIKTHGTYVDEIIFKTKDNQIKYFILRKTIYLNLDKSVGGTVCVMNEITKEIKQREILLQQSKLEQMGEMIASIAHQWNEPLVELSAQIQKLEYLFLNSNLDDKKVSKFVYDSMVQVKYMSETLNDFRNFLKPCKKKKSFDIKEAIREIFDIIGRQMSNFGIKIVFDYQEYEKQIYIYAYKNEIKQILLNVLNNAKNKIVKLAENENFQGKITIKIRDNKEFIIIKIIDNAGAMDEKIKEHIFEPFFTTKDSGTGYGLYMAKEIIETRHNGKINAKNYKNSVIFTIKLPKKQDNENFTTRR